MKTLLLLPAALLAAHMSLAQTFTPVTLTGFNADVVADGTGDAMSVTTHDFDSANFNLVAQGYTTPAGLSPTSYLPASGLITSVVSSTPGLTYQLMPYSGNNSMRLSGTASGTLSFTTPRAAMQVYLLAASGSGISNATATVNFTDGTTQVFPLSVSDWYNGTDYAIQGISRVKRTTSVLENSTLNPRLYQHLLTISTANMSKPISSISFAKLTPVGVLNVMGVTIRASVTGTSEAIAVTEMEIYPNPSHGEYTVAIPATTEQALLRITDLSGRTVSTLVVAPKTENKQVNLELGDQPAGIYLLTLEAADRVQQFRLVKK